MLMGIMYVCGSKELLIDNFFFQNRDGRLPLHFAATNTSIEKFKSLLGAFPNAGGQGNEWVIVNIFITKIQKNISKNTTRIGLTAAVMTQDKNGWLPMHHAAYASTSAAVVKAVHEAYPEAISKPHYSGCYAIFVNVWYKKTFCFVSLVYVQFAVR